MRWGPTSLGGREVCWEMGDRGGARASVGSHGKVNLTGLGNWWHVGGKEETSDPGSLRHAALTYVQGMNGRVGLEEAG